MGDYKYDVDDLSGTVTGLGQLISDYENASKVQEASAGVFGYSGLAGAVESFVDNWKHHREKQLETLTGTHDSLQDITENYVEQDEGAAEELRSQDGGK